MLLALDVGNTNVVGGLYRGETLLCQWRVSTETRVTADELLVLWSALLRTRGYQPNDLSGACLASVVPDLTDHYRRLTEQFFAVPTVTIGAGIDLGIAVRADNPVEVGADRLANTLAAGRKYGTPAVVVDFGTATNFDVAAADGAYVGGAIAPGMGPSMEALVSRTARLFRVPLTRPEHAIGRNTVACLQSGAFFGYVGLVDGLLRRILSELDGSAAVIATGGLAEVLAPEVPLIQHVDPQLTLDGIRMVWELNTPHPLSHSPTRGKGEHDRGTPSRVGEGEHDGEAPSGVGEAGYQGGTSFPSPPRGRGARGEGDVRD
jgi:type III pantothenate kinase